VLEPDPLVDEPPPTGKKGPAGREVQSPPSQVIWFVAMTLIGFSATCAALWFGPGTVEYVKDLSGPSPRVAKNSEGARKSNPWSVPEVKPVWDASKTPIYQPPSLPSVGFPQGKRISGAGGGGTNGFSFHR
jgi:hypothetical protein